MRNDDYMLLLEVEIDGEVSLCALRDAVKEKKIWWHSCRLAFPFESFRSLDKTPNRSRGTQSSRWQQGYRLLRSSRIFFSSRERKTDRNFGELQLLMQYWQRSLAGQVDQSVVVGQNWASLLRSRRGSWGVREGRWILWLIVLDFFSFWNYLNPSRIHKAHWHLGLHMEGVNLQPLWMKLWYLSFVKLSAMSLRRFLSRNRNTDRSSLENDRTRTYTSNVTTATTHPLRPWPWRNRLGVLGRCKLW